MDMLIGKIIIPPDPYQYCLRVDRLQTNGSLSCTRFDLSESRQPLTTGCGDPLHVVTPIGYADGVLRLKPPAWGIGPDRYAAHRHGGQMELF